MEIKVMPPKEVEPDDTPLPLPDPRTFALVLTRDIELEGNNVIEEGTVIGQMRCDLGIDPAWMCRNLNRFIRAVPK